MEAAFSGPLFEAPTDILVTQEMLPNWQLVAGLPIGYIRWGTVPASCSDILSGAESALANLLPHAQPA
jgi:hypothetical protein